MLCVFSPRAEIDLEDIADYIARDNPERAVSFIRDLRTLCAHIAERPLAAPLRPQLGSDIRMLPFGRYLIFYTVVSEGVRIQRVLHGARDLTPLFDA